MYEKINKDGEWEFTRKGGTYKTDGDFFLPQDKEENPEETALFEARLNFTQNKMLWEDPQNSIEFLKAEKKYTLKVGEDSDITEVFDGVAEKTTRTFKSGMTVEIDGKNDVVTITTAAGAQLVVNGSSGKIELSSSMVDIGVAVSDLAVLFSELASAYNSHTHAFTDQTPSGPVPSVTEPPVGPLIQSVASATVKLQP